MAKQARKILTWVLLPIVTAAVVFGVELFCQRGVWTLPAEQRGVSALDLSAVSVTLPEGSEDTGEDWEEDDEDFSEEYDEEASYDDEEDAYAAYDEDDEYAQSADGETAPVTELTLPQGASATWTLSGYVGEITLVTEDGSNQPFTLQRSLPGGRVETTSHVFATAANRDATHIGQEVTALTLTFTEGDVTVTAIEIDNTFRLNGNRMLLTGLLTACVYLLIALRSVISQRLEIGFLIIALTAGLYMSIGLPLNPALSYDGLIHFEQVWRLSQGKVSCEDTAMERHLSQWNTVRSNMFFHSADTETDETLFVSLLDDAPSSLTGETETLQWHFSDVGYLTQTAGFGLGKLLGLPFHVQFILGRVANMLTYVVLCYLGIRTLKRFKATMATLALTATPLFISANYSYDPTINGLCFLGIALVMDAILDRQTRLTWQRGVSILLCLMLGALTKVVYMPLLLLVLLLPRRKFDSRASRLWYKSFAMMLMVLAVLSMLVSVSDGTVTLQDSRADGADSALQMSFILAHPLTYLGYFFSTLWNRFAMYFVEYSRIDLSYVGMVNQTVSVLGLALLLFCAFTDNDSTLNQHLSWKQRLFMLLTGGLAVGMVFTTMYVAYSPVGLCDFGGVQGRYVIPVLPLMWMLLSPDGIKNRMNKTGWHLFLCLANTALIGAVCIQLYQTYFL